METNEDPMWAGLGSIDAFISSPTHSSSSPSSPWNWTRPPLPSVLQVRLDGEPAEESAPDLDLLLPSLPLSTTRIEKNLSHAPPPLALPPPIKKERIKVENDIVNIGITPKELPTIVKVPVHQQQGSVVRRALVGPGLVARSSPNAGVTVGGVVKNVTIGTRKDIEAGVSLKEKREREARQFPREVLGNLDGTTSAEVRKMNATERELVLYKRKLRNRESARRSRQKRQATLAELQEEIDDLMQVTGRMVEVGISLHEENVKLRDRLTAANKEVGRLKAGYADEGGTTATSAAFKMKLGG